MVWPDIFVIKILIFYRNDNKKCQKYFAEKMKDLALEVPEWYHTTTRYDYFDYYMFHRVFSKNLEKVTETLTVPKPETSSGSFGGGSSGGGFSGGGFGGGGGGSW